MRVTKSVVHREVVLLVLLIAAATIGFFLTRAAAADSRQARLADAASWAGIAQLALDESRRSEAIDALRHAAALDRDNREYQLTLARALAEDGSALAAQQVLLRLRILAPEDPAVNLQLARLSAHLGDIDDAVRYYQNALYGVWAPDEEARRREIRVELVQFLIAHEEEGRALSELLVLNANLPQNDIDAEIEVARLFLEAGESNRALDRFTSALQEAPEDPRALAGAGEAAFALGEYARARTYLRRAPDVPRVAELRPVVDLVLTGDPLAPRLASAERRRRLTAAFEQASRRLDTCLAGPSPDPAPLQALHTEAVAFADAVDEGALRRSPDAVDTGFELAFRIERATEAGCGPVEPLDRAIVLIGRRHGLETS